MSPQCQGYICGRVVQVGSSEILEGAAGGEREREREGGWAADAWEGGRVQSSRAELCRGGMQIVSMCGEDRRAELAAGRCG